MNLNEIFSPPGSALNLVNLNKQIRIGLKLGELQTWSLKFAKHVDLD